MPRSVVSGVRVRFDARGRLELSAEDLRASGVEDLRRLAEADRSSSTSLVSRGDDDGWLSLQEVEKAVGIHTAIIGGYYAVLDSVGRDRPKSLPLADVLELMKQGGSGPVRHRRRPREKKRPADLILNPPKHDPQHPGAHPRFLDRWYGAIESALGRHTEAKRVSRGFTLPGYGGPELVRYLHGDWRGLIASHTFSQTLRASLAEGLEFHAALEKTASQITRDVIRDITKEGYTAYAGAQSRQTQIGVANKKATAMASYVDSPLEAPQLTPTAFGYAASGLLSLIAHQTLEKTHPMIMLEVEQKVPKDHQGPEFYIPSHVPPERIQRAFLGFSTWHDVRAYLVPPAREERWFELGVVARDDRGRPTEFTLAPAKARESGYSERWSVGAVAWRSSQPDGPGAAAFLEAHPELGPTVDAILELTRSGTRSTGSGDRSPRRS